MLRFLALTVFLSTSLFAQAGLTPQTQYLIDTSLRLMDMTRADMAMHWDMVKDDVHRLAVVKKFFGEPLATFSYTSTVSGLLKQGDETGMDQFFERAMADAELGKFNSYTFDLGMSAKQVDDALRKDLDSLGGLVSASMLRMYLAPLIQTRNIVVAARKPLLANKVVMQDLDSMFMSGGESAGKSLYELRSSEIDGLERAKTFFAAAASPDLANLHSAGLSLYRTYLVLLRRMATNMVFLKDSIRPLILETAIGKVAIGGPGNDTYQGDYTLIIDAGGDDTYILNSGLSKDGAISIPVRCIIDKGGNDRYLGGQYSLASAVAGVSIVIDAGGNDSYQGGDFSIASALFGVGVLHDLAGSDTYIGGTFSQAASAFGLAILRDDAGNDTYRSEGHSQAFASTRGYAVLLDNLGNDNYIAASNVQDFLRYDSHFETFSQGAALGYRPVASGGIALLVDRRGNDTYVSDIYGQGTAYWFGLGSLLDEEGDDRYVSYQYAQGAGVHFAHGILWDRKGDDSYNSHGVSQGCGHDVAFGALVDEDGADMYSVESLSLGGGNANAVSLFVDERGNDLYSAANTGNTLGYSDFRRSYGMIGVFVDGGGVDRYGETTQNNRHSTKSTYGIRLDADINRDFTPPAQSSTPDAEKEPLRSDLDSLFMQASAAPQKYQYNVEPARAAIVALGAQALSFLGSKLGSELPRERLALEQILPKVMSSDSLSYTTMLLDSLSSRKWESTVISATVLGRKKVKRAVPYFLEMLEQSDWRARALAALSLGEIGDSTVFDTLAAFRGDEHPMVRARIAYALSGLDPARALQVDPSMSLDIAQVVRNSFASGFKKRAPLSKDIMSQAFSSLQPVQAKRYYAQFFASADTSDKVAAETYSRLVLAQSEKVREQIYRNLLESPAPFWKNFMLALREPSAELQAMFGIGTMPASGKKRGKK